MESRWPDRLSPLPRQRSRIMLGLEQRLHEPLNALTHLFGTVAALVGLLTLLHLSWGQGSRAVPLAVYGLTLVALFASSTLLHGARVPARWHMRFNRLDHVAIFWLIAGTYTPIIVTFFRPQWRAPLLIAVWGVALAGSAVKLLGRRIHGFLQVWIYLLLGWGGILPAWLASTLFTGLPWQAMGLLAAGGACYSIGFLTYYFKWPDPWPNVFGHHEIWHLYVLGGSAAHFFFMLSYVVPHPLV